MVFSLVGMLLQKFYTSFNTVNTESVEQRASKLLDLKVVGLKKKSAALAITPNCVQSIISKNLLTYFHIE